MNINEIARLAGVSRATVSRYLNNGYVSEGKREQIRRVIDETGYKPSAQARQLRSRQTKMIGVILPKINSESVSRMVAGISLVLSKEGYQLLLGNTDNDEKEEIKYLKLFEAHQVDGIILIGTVLTGEHYRAMKAAGLPVVILGQQSDRYSCVYHDDYNAARELTACLLREGKKPAYIGVTQRDAAAGAGRRRGYLEALKIAGRSGIQEIRRMKEAAFSYESGYEKAREIMEELPDTDAIFCATDSIAVGALMYLREKGIAVPEQVQLTGIGDTLMGRTAAVGITTAHYYYKTSGQEAAELLLGMIQSGEDIRREIKMGYRIIVRGSTKG